jgi:hypothetical protein
VIHSWKGPHHSGDTLTFGWPFGNLYCDEGRTSWFDVEPDEDFGVADPDGGNYFFDYVFVMFLRQPKGEETQMVQGLLPAAGDGLQGWFWIKVDSQRPCMSIQDEDVQRCDTYLKTSHHPVMIPYPRDPLKNKYGGMLAADFLREVQSVADQGFATKSSLRRAVSKLHANGRMAIATTPMQAI